MSHRKTLASLVQRVRDNLDEQTTGRFSDAIIVRAINVGKDRTWNEVRRSSGDYFLTSLASTANNPQTILGESYNPASLQVTVSGTTLTLPHDFASLKLLEVITSSYETVRFRHVDMASVEFRAAREITDNLTPTELVFDLINERTLIYAPKSSVALDTRLFYVFKVADLTTGDTLQMPAPLDRAVEAYATSEVMLGDYAPESAVWEQKGRSWIAEFFAADYRQSQDVVLAEPGGVWGDW